MPVIREILPEAAYAYSGEDYDKHFSLDPFPTKISMDGSRFESTQF